MDALFLQPRHSMDTLVSEEASTVLDTELPARGTTRVRPPVDSTMSSSLDLSMPEVQEREVRTTPALQAGESRAFRPKIPTNREQGGLLQIKQSETVQESSSSASTVQVTIGRIEVRAMPPPTPRTHPQRSGPPVMSLEEYLNQRAKGGY